MPRFSAFAPFGLLRFARKEPLSRAIYDAMVAGKTPAFDMTRGTAEEAKTYAQAMGMARGREIGLGKAQNQTDPRRVKDLLPKSEADWAIVPGEDETIATRQDNLAARQLIARGARRSNVEEILRAILGDDFLALRTLTPSEITTWPTDPFAAASPGNWVDPTLPPRFGALREPLALPGIQRCYYTTLEVDDVYQVGTTMTIERENTLTAERVTVTAAGEDAFGKYFEAVFINAHGADASIMAGACPIWFSTQRYILVVVAASAAVNPEKRRRVNEQLDRVLRGTSQWAIVKPYP